MVEIDVVSGAERKKMNKRVLNLITAMEKSKFSVINVNTKPIPIGEGFAIVYRVDFQVDDTTREAPQSIEEFYHLLKSLEEDCQH